MTALRKLRAVLVAALSLGILMPAAISNTAEAQAPGAPGFREVGQLSHHPHTTSTGRERPNSILLDVERRKGFRVIGGPDQGQPSQITRFNLDSLQDEDTATFPDINLDTAGFQAENELMATIGGGRIYVVNNRSSIHVIDQDTLQEVAWFPGPMPSGSTLVDPVPTGGGAGFDAEGWLASDPCQQGLADCVLEAPNHINTDDPDVTGTRALTQRRPVSNQPVVIGGLEYMAGEGERGGKLLVLTESPNTGDAPDSSQVVALSQWDAETGFEDWVAHLDACRNGRGAQSSKYGMGLAVRDAPGDTDLKEALIGCIGRGGNGEVWRVTFDPSDTIRLGDTDQLQPVKNQQRVVEVPGALDFYVDAEAQRMHVQTNGSAAGQTFVGIDLKRGGAYGLIFVSHQADLRNTNDNAVSAGIDPTTGRLYVLQKRTEQEGRVNQAGLLLVDGRRQPLPQGTLLEDLNPDGRSGINKIRVDPATGDRPARVYIRYDDENFVRVFEDTVPVRDDIALGNIDRFTLDIPESEDTQASFNATTNSYGVRSIVFGGLYPVVPTFGNLGTQQFPRDVLQDEAPFGCEPDRREVTLADLLPGGNGLSDTGVTADAVPVTADPKTIQDGGEPFAACWPTEGLVPRVVNNLSGDGDGSTVNQLLDLLFTTLGKNPPETGPIPPPWPENAPDNGRFDDGDDEDESDPDEFWGQTVRDPFPYSNATCSRPGTADSSPHEGDDLTVTVNGVQLMDDPPPGFVAGVKCGEDGRSMTAFAAAARRVGFGDLLTLDGTATATEIRWREDGGAVVTTTSVVEGVSFAGVTIDRVVNTVTSEAAGRPGTAAADIERAFCGVVGPGINENGCFDLDSDEARAFIDGLSDNITERRGLELHVPPVDPDLRQGTPGGAQSALQKDRFTAEGDRVLDSDSRTTVAALEVVHTNDSRRNGRARQIYQFAGAENSTAYFISKRPPSFDFDFGGFDAPQQQFAAETPVTIPGEEATAPTPPRVLAESASASPTQPGPTTIQGGPLEAVARGLKWLLRNPLEALKIAMLIFTAFGLPIHLHSRRRVIATALMKET